MLRPSHDFARVSAIAAGVRRPPVLVLGTVLPRLVSTGTGFTGRLARSVVDAAVRKSCPLDPNGDVPGPPRAGLGPLHASSLDALVRLVWLGVPGAHRSSLLKRTTTH
jgi:hypothetical protein